MTFRVVNGFNTDRMGNRVMPIYKTEVWIGDKWIASSVGWKADETEEHAIKRARETLSREMKTP